MVKMSVPDLSKEIPLEERTYYYAQAGQITFEVFEEVKQMIQPGIKIIDICRKAQQLILEKAAHPSGPCVVAVNNIVAYYTSPSVDETVIPENSVVKLDLGAHINGFIANKAETITFDDNYKPLIESSNKAWTNAMELVRVGTETSMLGVAVEDTIREFDFLPIRELYGHQLDRFQIHGEKILPNIKMPYSKADSVMELDDVYSFDVFSSTGSGSVHQDVSKTFISMLKPLLKPAPLRSKTSRAIRNYIYKEYFTLPFTERWVTDNSDFHPARVRLTLRELKRSNSLIEFPVLSDEKDSFVSHYKNTFYVTNERFQTITMPPFDFEKPDSIKALEEAVEESEKVLESDVE